MSRNISHKVSEKREGDYFGETSLITEDSRRTAWVRADRFCVLETLEVTVINDLIKHEYPKAYVHIIKTMARYHEIAPPLAAAMKAVEELEESGRA